MNETQHRLALPQGTRIGDFEFHRVLGHGGFGITYLGWNHALDIPVAIKEYLPADLATRERDLSVVPQSSQVAADFQWGLDRFIDEARILARFQHPNIVRVHHFFSANSTAYIVMEYAEGETLSAYLNRKGVLTESELKAILHPILNGLEEVHRADFLHRDIKPGNIIIRDKDESPVLIDFGAARQAVGAKSRSVTSIVTPGYAPIEQYSTRGDQGPWTDIYALGGVCYRALTDDVPDDATDRVRRDPLIPVSDRCRGHASHEFLAAIDHALQVDEDARPQSVSAWRAELGDARQGLIGNSIDAIAIDELPDRPLRKDVQKILSEKGLANAAQQFGVSAAELDRIRMRYDLQIKKRYDLRSSKTMRKSRGKVLWAVLGMLALLAVAGVVIYDPVERARLTEERNRFITEMGREPSLYGVNPEGETDLHIASFLNLPTLTLYLLNKGAAVHEKDKDGHTPLHTIFRTNIQAAYVHEKDKDGHTPLHWTAIANARETAEVLLKHGADVNARDEGGYTPLHVAAYNNAHETAALLRRHGGRE